MVLGILFLLKIAFESSIMNHQQRDISHFCIEADGHYGTVQHLHCTFDTLLIGFLEVSVSEVSLHQKSSIYTYEDDEGRLVSKCSMNAAPTHCLQWVAKTRKIFFLEKRKKCLICYLAWKSNCCEFLYFAFVCPRWIV